MKKSLFILSAILPLLSFAQPRPESLYFTEANPELTKQEKAALKLARHWREGKGAGTAPVTGADGSVKFLFGAQQTSIVCAVLQICDIELQPGEQVNSIHLGDAARWVVEPAITGSGSSEIQHLIVKPLDVGLETALLITTDRRTYHLKLRSHRKEYMPRISFTYPETAMALWEKTRKRESAEKLEKTLPQTGEYMGNLDFAYTLEGETAWKPVRVYNDGIKTIIQMPASLAQTEAPTLLVVRKDGGFWTDEELVMVNYRVQGDRYIVDTVFKKAILIAGIGDSQERITITRE